MEEKSIHERIEILEASVKQLQEQINTLVSPKGDT